MPRLLHLIIFRFLGLVCVHPSVELKYHLLELEEYLRSLKERYSKPEGGGEWEPIKILLEGDGDSYKTNTSSNTRL
jgi:hypothetical protein